MAERESGELTLKKQQYQQVKTITIIDLAFVPAFVPAAKKYFFNYAHIEALIPTRPTPPRGYTPLQQMGLLLLGSITNLDEQI